MNIAEIKALKDRRPFVPFLIRTADGREFEIAHPDAMAWHEESSRAIMVTPKNGRWEIIETALITSLSLKNRDAMMTSGTKAQGN